MLHREKIEEPLFTEEQVDEICEILESMGRTCRELAEFLENSVEEPEEA